MRISDEELISSLGWPDLIEALRRQFREGCEVPPRHHHTMKMPGQADATMLLMPAWQTGGRIGVKLVNVFPDNTKRKLPAISADYLLYDGETGQSLASMNGAIITAYRTAAAAALGADFLAREDSQVLYVVGAGQVASLVPEAMKAVRPIQRVLVWDINSAGAEKLCAQLKEIGFDAEPEFDLRAGTAFADIVSCATLSTEPLIKGS